MTHPISREDIEHDPYFEKFSRINAGGSPRVVDLFSGCGGFSLGFKRAGFEIIGGIEIDPDAASSHAINFQHNDTTAEEASNKVLSKDILTLEPEEFVAGLGFDEVESAADVLIGGPPCQSYARVGRAKLREVANHPHAFKVDPRGNLYLRYIHYVEKLKPLVIVMENVPDVLNYGGHNVAEETAEVLKDLGYESAYTLLNAVFYGVPQMRERMFLIAFHRSLGTSPSFPDPTHDYELPRGYLSSRRVAKKLLPDHLLEISRFVEPPKPDKAVCAPAVTVGQAIRDLPRFTEHLEGEIRRSARKLDIELSYRRSRPTWFSEQMRKWPGFETDGTVNANVIRYLPRDFKIFARMRPGDQYPEAHRLAERMFQEYLTKKTREGRSILPDSPAFEEARLSFVPPYDPSKFPNKWRKLSMGEPSRTLMAHLGKDSYSHIHPDSRQARTISVREAARLQSFPDGFQFSGAMNAAFRQIGNAVPPMLAYRIADHIAQEILDLTN